MTSEQSAWITGEVIGALKLTEERKEDVERLVARIGNMIQIRCNREDIPKMLEPVIAQIAEEMIREEETSGSSSQGSGSGAVSSITRGDTSIAYRDDTAVTQAASRLMKDYEPQIRRFKKMNLPK